MMGWPKVGPRGPHTLPPRVMDQGRPGKKGAFPGRPTGGGDRGGGVDR